MQTVKDSMGPRKLDLASLEPESLEKLRVRNNWRSVLQKNLQNITKHLLSLDDDRTWLADPRDLMKVLDRRMKTTTN